MSDDTQGDKQDQESLQKGVNHKVAILLLAKGFELPAFLQSLSLRTRIAAVMAIENEFPDTRMGEALFDILILEPAKLSEVFAADEQLAVMFGALAAVASLEMLTWTSDDMAKIMKDAVGLVKRYG